MMNNQENTKIKLLPGYERATSADEIGMMSRNNSIFNNPKGYSLQEAFEENGGFGKALELVIYTTIGRFQWIITVILSMGFMTTYFLTYSISYLEL